MTGKTLWTVVEQTGFNAEGSLGHDTFGAGREPGSKNVRSLRLSTINMHNRLPFGDAWSIMSMPLHLAPFLHDMSGIGRSLYALSQHLGVCSCAWYDL